MEISAPAERASMKALVPDLAIVPKLLTKSAFVMPIPLKKTVKLKSCLQFKQLEIFNLRITKSKSTVILVGDNLDFKVLATVQLAGVSQGFITDLV